MEIINTPVVISETDTEEYRKKQILFTLETII